MPKKPPVKKTVSAISHPEDRRTNIPTAEFQSVVDDETKAPKQYKYPRNTDLDPQLVWRGKDEQDWSDLVAYAPPLYIQEKVHPKALIDELLRRSDADRRANEKQIDLFSDFNGFPEGVDKTEFYRHDQNWSNRMILGDSLQVMASLAEREALKGKTQCIYFDPPYGIKFNSNFQWSTTSRDVKDGNLEHITREPEQVKAFRDTWRDGIHSYLAYLRDRLTVARELLAESGSIFVQIGDENVHRVRALMDEVFGEDNYISIISLQKTAARSSEFIQNVADYVVWYAKNSKDTKFHNLFNDRPLDDKVLGQYPFIYNEDGSYVANQNYSITPSNDNLARSVILTSSHEYSRGKEAILFQGKKYGAGSRYWSTSPEGIYRLAKSNRIVSGGTSVSYLRRLSDYPYIELNNTWTDVATGGGSDRVYVVQTVPKVIQRCILMTTDPGDLVLDPTCGSGTTAYVAEQWGRRWITIDTSRVALALARSRIMGARYPYYLLADSAEGQMKEAELTQTLPSGKPAYNRVRHGFVYERVPHITLKSIANNTEIDVIWEKYQTELEAALAGLNAALRGFKSPFRIETGARAETWIHFQNPHSESEYATLPNGEKAPSFAFLEWEVPRNPPRDCTWPEKAVEALAAFWKIKIKRQKEIDASIAAKAEFEYLYDKPYEDKRKVRVAGPFTVDSISPHRALGVDEKGDIIDGQTKTFSEVREHEPPYGFAEIILENLKTAGVQQAHRDDKITFTSLAPWPGNFVCAEGFYREGDEETGTDRRTAIFIGPEFGTVTRPDLIEAAREAADAGFDLLIACAFNYEAHTTEFEKLGKIKILKARMNADLHMAGDLRNNGKGNLFVIFGEPDIDVEPAPEGQIRVRIKGVDVFHPNTGEIRSDGPERIACWFIDTDYNEESFFVRHAYFLGANDPYGALKTSLKAEINPDAWESLHSDISRPFDKPASGRIAIKVINHLGDEVMKVINVHKL